jgi:hypothetical protein
MSGKAQLGIDYTLSGTPGQVVIPAGQSSATVIFNALTDNLSERNEIAKMALTKGAGYKASSPAMVTIVNVP